MECQQSKRNQLAADINCKTVHNCLNSFQGSTRNESDSVKSCRSDHVVYGTARGASGRGAILCDLPCVGPWLLAMGFGKPAVPGVDSKQCRDERETLAGAAADSLDLNREQHRLGGALYALCQRTRRESASNRHR